MSKPRIEPIPAPCKECGESVIVDNHKRRYFQRTGIAYCAKHMRGGSLEAACFTCGIIVTLIGSKRSWFKQSGRTFCCDEHRDQWLSKSHSDTAKSTIQKYGLRFLDQTGNKHSVETKKKISDRTPKIAPPIRGGNGKGLTETQSSILSQIPELSPEYSVSEPGMRKSGLPCCYKIDLAHVPSKTAIEIDGKSHYSDRVRLADSKKEKWLTERGWKVIRFTNKRIQDNVLDCVSEILSRISAQE